MPIETGIWRLDGTDAERVPPTNISDEARLERILMSDVAILGLGSLLILGSQVVTDFGGRIDILALDGDKRLNVIEVKKARTPRDVVAQALDYGSWAREQTVDDLADIFARKNGGASLAEAFEDQFGEELDGELLEPRLVIVGSDLDFASERIVDYLADLGVGINVVFFRVFNDRGHEYLTRSWLIDPQTAERKVAKAQGREKVWNGKDWYISFGENEHRQWSDARRYGYVSAGGGPRWSGPLKKLQPGHRVFVNALPMRYVGIGEVIGEAEPVTEFAVDVDGATTSILNAPLNTPSLQELAQEPERYEWFVPVRWDVAVDLSDGYWETGLFANQAIACRMFSQPTIEKVCEHFGVEA